MKFLLQALGVSALGAGAIAALSAFCYPQAPVVSIFWTWICMTVFFFAMLSLKMLNFCRQKGIRMRDV